MIWDNIKKCEFGDIVYNDSNIGIICNVEEHNIKIYWIGESVPFKKRIYKYSTPVLNQLRGTFRVLANNNDKINNHKRRKGDNESNARV